MVENIVFGILTKAFNGFLVQSPFKGLRGKFKEFWFFIFIKLKLRKGSDLR